MKTSPFQHLAASSFVVSRCDTIRWTGFKWFALALLLHSFRRTGAAVESAIRNRNLGSVRVSFMTGARIVLDAAAPALAILPPTTTYEVGKTSSSPSPVW